MEAQPASVSTTLQNIATLHQETVRILDLVEEELLDIARGLDVVTRTLRKLADVHDASMPPLPRPPVVPDSVFAFTEAVRTSGRFRKIPQTG